MSDLSVLKGLLVLLACQLAGEVVVRLFGIELPGPVVGMLVFLVVLRVARPQPSSGLVLGPALLLRHLQLLFVPAGVGVIVYLDVFRAHAWPFAAGLWVSWFAGLAVTGVIVGSLVRVTGRARR